MCPWRSAIDRRMALVNYMAARSVPYKAHPSYFAAA